MEPQFKNRTTRIRTGQPYIARVVMCWSLRHVLSTEGPCRPHGRRHGQPDGFVRETFSARAKAKAFLKSYPKAAYMSEVERWRE
jgi:hypothetical protein